MWVSFFTVKGLSSLNDGCRKESPHNIKNNKYVNLNFWMWMYFGPCTLYQIMNLMIRNPSSWKIRFLIPTHYHCHLELYQDNLLTQIHFYFPSWLDRVVFQIEPTNSSFQCDGGVRKYLFLWYSCLCEHSSMPFHELIRPKTFIPYPSKSPTAKSSEKCLQKKQTRPCETSRAKKIYRRKI